MYEEDEYLDAWYLCDVLSVYHAALLIAELNPNAHHYYPADSSPIYPSGLLAAFTALKNAVKSGKLKARIVHDAYEHGDASFISHDDDWQITEEFYIKRKPYNEFAEYGIPINSNLPYRIAYNLEPDWQKTTIDVEDLRKWLSSRGVKKGFFFPQNDMPDIAPYLDKNNTCYSPKLAAAVNAWEAVSSNPNLQRGKSVKSALEKWVREHAAEFELTDDEGKQNENGIKEVTKVANWDTKGGAPETPTE